MYAHLGYHQNAGRLEQHTDLVQVGFRRTLLKIKQLGKAVVAMRFYLPVVLFATLYQWLAVNQVGGRRVLCFAIESYDGDGGVEFHFAVNLRKILLYDGFLASYRGKTV